MVRTPRRILAVFKPRIGVAIPLCTIAGMAMMPGTSLPAWKIAVLGLAVFLSSAAAGAFNPYADREPRRLPKLCRD